MTLDEALEALPLRHIRIGIIANGLQGAVLAAMVLNDWITLDTFSAEDLFFTALFAMCAWWCVKGQLVLQRRTARGDAEDEWRLP